MGQDNGSIELPVGERIVHKSELFDVRIVDKRVRKGLTKDVFLFDVLVLDSDPLIDRRALVMVEKDIYETINIGEMVKLRLYEQLDGKWNYMPPKVGG